MNLVERDKKVVWHPYTSLITEVENIPLASGEGIYLIDESGNKYIDAISSWWVNVHGHAHPYLAQKVFEQFSTLEHSIFAGFTHPKAVELAERILRLLPDNQSRVFFSDNGSTAVEVGIKMALQYWHNQGINKRRIIALDGSYHGDTFGSMSVSGRGGFNAPFESLLFDVDFVSFPKDDSVLEELQVIIDREEVAAFIFEPLVQGAAGMRMYSAELLDKMIALCQANDVLCIADEVMTGFGRTGKMFACNHLKNQPDIFSMSKGLTGGSMPLSLTTCSQKIIDQFMTGDKMKTFFHGHSFTANAIGCAVSCASLDLFEKVETKSSIARIEQQHNAFAVKLNEYDCITNIRITGTIIAFELVTDEATSYFNSKRNDIYQFFISRGVILRPLGNVIYILPPYCITVEELDAVYITIEAFLQTLS
jgi:adenosylmethionine-8-amino-7-oxononanoate aminotransferase